MITGGKSMSEAFEQAWLLLKQVNRQSRLPGYEGQMIADSRRSRRRDGRGFADEGPRQMGPFLEGLEEVLNDPRQRERYVARRRMPARIVRTFENPTAAGFQFDDAVTYALEDEAGERLAEIHTNRENQISDFAGEVPAQHRRKGYYRELIENLIRHGFPLTSHSRNEMSDPFHKKFIRTLPDDIDVSTIFDSSGDSEYDDHHYTHAPYFPGKHGPGGDWGDLRGPHRITVPFFDRSSESYRTRDLEVPGPIAGRPHYHRNRDIIVPTEAAREILARDNGGFDYERRRVINSLKNAQREKGIDSHYSNPSYGLVQDAPMRLPNPAYGSRIFSQSRLPGLLESDYAAWEANQPLFPMDDASEMARRTRANYIQ